MQPTSKTFRTIDKNHNGAQAGWKSLRCLIPCMKRETKWMPPKRKTLSWCVYSSKHHHIHLTHSWGHASSIPRKFLQKRHHIWEPNVGLPAVDANMNASLDEFNLTNAMEADLLTYKWALCLAFSRPFNTRGHDMNRSDLPNLCHMRPVVWGCNLHFLDLNPYLKRRSSPRLIWPWLCILSSRNLFCTQSRICHSNLHKGFVNAFPLTGTYSLWS